MTQLLNKSVTTVDVGDEDVEEEDEVANGQARFSGLV